MKEALDCSNYSTVYRIRHCLPAHDEGRDSAPLPAIAIFTFRRAPAGNFEVSLKKRKVYSMALESQISKKLRLMFGNFFSIDIMLKGKSPVATGPGRVLPMSSIPAYHGAPMYATQRTCSPVLSRLRLADPATPVSMPRCTRPPLSTLTSSMPEI
ncbi:hypothetical protein EAG_01906 [Camponotus floridanus]|uniref:Uncharacterized protein n=1 Tax=Camponotus floridanus TaxID=104421 RepID=E1ZZ05_CAMFO|nr:hypothetical protein EAG_01906 [Camponotus floridanus]